MAVKAFIIEVPDDKNSEKRVCVQAGKISESDDQLESAKADQSQIKKTGEMTFLTPGCMTGEGCNHCGNCH